MTIFITPAAKTDFEITYTYSLLLNGKRLKKINKIEIKKIRAYFFCSHSFMKPPFGICIDIKPHHYGYNAGSFHLQIL